MNRYTVGAMLLIIAAIIIVVFFPKGTYVLVYLLSSLALLSVLAGFYVEARVGKTE